MALAAQRAAFGNRLVKWSQDVVAWLALGVLAAIQIWLFFDDLEVALLATMTSLAWMLFGVFFIFSLLPPIGLWLLFTAVRRGGGRWGWRWILGVLLPYYVALFPIEQISSDIQVGTLSWGELRLWLSYAAQVAMAAPIWVLTARRPADRA